MSILPRFCSHVPMPRWCPRVWHGVRGSPPHSDIPALYCEGEEESRCSSSRTGRPGSLSAHGSPMSRGRPPDKGVPGQQVGGLLPRMLEARRSHPGGSEPAGSPRKESLFSLLLSSLLLFTYLLWSSLLFSFVETIKEYRNLVVNFGPHAKFVALCYGWSMNWGTSDQMPKAHAPFLRGGP